MVTMVGHRRSLIGRRPVDGPHEICRKTLYRGVKTDRTQSIDFGFERKQIQHGSIRSDAMQADPHSSSANRDSVT